MCACIIYEYFTSIYSIYYTNRQKFVSFRQNFTPFDHPCATARCARFQGNFRLILCKNPQFLHKNKKFCMSDFSKNQMFLTKLANILNFICQICNFFTFLLTRFARSGGTPKLERTLIQCVLIRGMCQFWVRAARRRENGAPSLKKSTRMRGILLRSRHAGEVA